MKILADEHVEREIVEWLRSVGHDVLWVAESCPATPDDELLRLAGTERQVVLTKDLDFGELVFHSGLTHAPVILIRLQSLPPSARPAALKRAWPQIERISGRNLIVVTPHRLRVRPFPNDEH